MPSPSFDTALEAGQHPETDTIDALITDADTYADMDAVTPTPEQQHIIDAIMQKPYGLHAISGIPGSGKSLLLRCLARRLMLAQKQVRMFASTGAAATRLAKTATTVHAGFNVPRDH